MERIEIPKSPLAGRRRMVARVAWTCPHCGQVLMLQPCRARTQKACSRACAAKAAAKSDNRAAKRRAKALRQIEEYRLEQARRSTPWSLPFCPFASGMVEATPFGGAF